MTDRTSSPYTGYASPPPAPPAPPAPPMGAGDDASMKDKATESAQAGKEAAADLAHTAAAQASEVATEAQQQVKNVITEARDQLRSHAGDQHRSAVTNLHSLGDELRSMAESSQGGGVATDLVGQAADRAHGVADWLGDRRPEDLLDELRRFARRRPGTFLAGALIAGVAAGRLTRGAVAVHTDDNESVDGNARPEPMEMTTTPVVAAAPGPQGGHPVPVGYPADPGQPAYPDSPYGSGPAAPYGAPPAAPYGAPPVGGGLT